MHIPAKQTLHNLSYLSIIETQQASPALPSSSQTVGEQLQSSSELPANSHSTSTSGGVAGELRTFHKFYSVNNMAKVCSLHPFEK